MNETIFRKKSLERIASPDKLDDYLKVSSPSIWLILLALVLALIAAGAWCFFGKMPTTMAGVGIQSGTETLCFIPAEEGSSVEIGMQVQFTSGETAGPVIGKVEEVSEPIPAGEAAENAGAAWLSLPAQWVCVVTVRLDNETQREGTVYNTQIILDERRPVDLLFGR